MAPLALHCILYHPICPHFIWKPQVQRYSSHNLEFSSSSPPNVYQLWHLLPSPQHPLFPAGLPTHLEPSSCTSDLTSMDHCAQLQITFTYLLNSTIALNNEAIVASRFHPQCTTHNEYFHSLLLSKFSRYSCHVLSPLRNTQWYATEPLWNMKSTKSQVHKVLQCNQRRTEPRPQATNTKYLMKFGHVVFELYEQTDRQTDRHTHHNTLHPHGGKVILTDSDHTLILSCKTSAYSVIKTTSFGSFILPLEPSLELSIFRILWTLPTAWCTTNNWEMTSQVDIINNSITIKIPHSELQYKCNNVCWNHVTWPALELTVLQRSLLPMCIQKRYMESVLQKF